VADAEHDLVIPEGGFWPAPAIPQPNIYPMEWRVETAKLAAIYEKSKLTVWNPADLPWDGLRPEDFTAEQRLGIMYWFSVLAPPSTRSSSTRRTPSASASSRSPGTR
jgi:hypothetical protein